jgi:hypothetical protein
MIWILARYVMGHVSKKTMIGTKVFITFVFKTTGRDLDS